MSKKFIAILTVATLLFVCVFAACEKEDKVYATNDEFYLVTDENGGKVLAEDGQLLVYATEENGKIVKDENGEKVTLRQQFQPIEEDGVIEDFGFKLTLPEGWETTDRFGYFINNKKQQECTISIVRFLYDDYYNRCYKNHEIMLDEGYDSVWEDDIDLGKGFGKAARFIVTTEEAVLIVGFFENAENVYKVHFVSLDKENAVEDFEVFCKSMDFKPFTYYDDITAVSTEKAEIVSTEKVTVESTEA